jgi:CO/xanthine dehydrogenase Mo-binding subunit
MAVESAMDELAHELRMDPVELRIRNEPQVHPETGQPFSDRRLVECMREGASRFGWDRRPKEPATQRDGRWLVGYGMAAAIRMHFQLPANLHFSSVEPHIIVVAFGAKIGPVSKARSSSEKRRKVLRRVFRSCRCPSASPKKSLWVGLGRSR